MLTPKPSRASTMREHRLLAMSGGATERHGQLEAAEAGRSTGTGTPEAKLESRTAQLLQEMDLRKPGFLELVKNFGSATRATKKATDAMLKVEAERIVAEHGLACGTIRGLFFRGRRRLYLAAVRRIEQGIAKDMLADLERLEGDSAERQRDIRSALGALKGRPVSVVIKSDRTRSRLRSALQSKQREAAAWSTGPFRKLEDARNAEDMLRRELLHRRAVDPAQIEALLERNAFGGSDLISVIDTSPELAREPRLRRVLRDTARLLRRTRGYRVVREVADINRGTLQERVGRLFSDERITGRRMRIALPHGELVNAVVLRRERPFITLQRMNGEGYIVMSDDGHMSYRASDRALRDAPLTSFSLEA